MRSASMQSARRSQQGKLSGSKKKSEQEDKQSLVSTYDIFFFP